MGQGHQAWLIAAMVLSLTGYATYLVQLRRDLLEPNRASWLVWAAAAGVEAATYAAVNPRQPQSWVFAASALACAGVTLSMWRRSRWGAPTPTERLCMGTSLAALLLWVAFQEAFWAHMLVVAAVPVSFWPTWQSVREDRNREASPAWGLWTLGDAAVLVLALRSGEIGVAGLSYVAVELVCHASVWAMVGFATIVPDRRRRPGHAFRVGTTHLGKAVFATRAFAGGDRLMRVSGRHVRAGRIGRLEGADDRFVQVGPDDYIGPSGRVDDLVNHSCDPNAGLRFARDGVFLVALRPIAPGEEVAWDYATSLGDRGWSMPCDCGAALCRGIVTAFATLPRDRQEWYLDRGVVAPYLCREPAGRAA